MEEMSVREIVETIIKGKSIIIGLTVICILVSLVINIFILDPIYEAQTMLMISPISKKSAGAEGIIVTEGINEFSSLVNAVTSYPDMSIDAYKEQIKAPVILQYIREQMGLKNVSLNSISDKITVEALKNTNLITVSVRDKNPETAAQIANILSERYTKFVSDTNKKHAENSAEIIETQMQKEKENLEKISDNLKNFLSQPHSPDELKMELESKLTQLTEFKTTLAQTKIDEENTRKSVEKAKSLLAQTPKTLVTNSTLYNDDLLTDIIKDNTGLSPRDMANIKLSNEEINQIYVDLSNSLNQLEIQLSNLESARINTEQAINECQKGIEVIQAEYAQKQQDYDVLNLELELSKQAYQAYQQEYKESMIKQSAEIGKSSIVVLSEAMVPVSPVAPKKAINVIVSGLAGLIIGTLVAFIKENMSSSTIIKHRRAA